MRFPRHVENLIASLRGLPEDRSRSRLRETLPVGDALDKVIEKHKLGKPRVEETIQQNLDTVLGSANAHYCRLAKVERGRVFIVVSHSVIRQELNFNRPLILKRLQALPGGSALREVVFWGG